MKVQLLFTLVFTPLVLAEDDSRTKRLVNAWQGKKGLLIHVAATEWAENVANAASNGTDAPFYIDNDCGPMCSAWSLASKGIPMAPATLSQLGVMIDAGSRFSEKYVQSLYPSDAGTTLRQFCAKKAHPTEGPSLSSFGTYGPPGITTVGCPEDDDDCKFLAAGGSPSLGAVWDPSTENWVSNYSKINNVTHYDLDMIRAGNATECKIPHKCSVYHPEQSPSAANWISNVVTPLLDRLATVKNQSKEYQDKFYQEMNVSYHIFRYGCKFDAKVPSNWEVVKEAYLKYLSVAVPMRYGYVGVHPPFWNEVNIYSPVEPTQKTVASKSFEQSIVGFFTTPSENATEGDIQDKLVKKLVLSYNKRNPDKPINKYNCTGRTQWKGMKFDKPVEDYIISKQGCIVDPMPLPPAPMSMAVLEPGHAL
eukprot:CAMPEP_0203748030 /NCGR_PEP_ID=MMETSP0098-20131031/3017_1 /ASSEMBLY_ACC=CAM_ASM_000208 /TAXON_ID=96639 /ORGANISM=" , Strain NY0313808BC1" /LENGTH=420 /DNA_ID=CAMNT_0050636641 /DNA_START=2326 /DNA_END=3588 /DNA_ORIENTATION=+